MGVRQYVAGALNSGSTATVTLTGVAAGSTIAVKGFSLGNVQTLSAPTDTGSNTYHLVWNIGSQGFAHYYAWNVVGGTVTITVTVSGFCSCAGPSAFQIVAYELDAPVGGGDPLDQHTEAQCTNGTTHWTGTAVTTGFNNTVALSSCWSVNVNSSLALGSTWSGGTLHTVSVNANYGSASEAVAASGSSVMADFNTSFVATVGNMVFLGLATYKSTAPASTLATPPPIIRTVRTLQARRRQGALPATPQPAAITPATQTPVIRSRAGKARITKPVILPVASQLARSTQLPLIRVFTRRSSRQPRTVTLPTNPQLARQTQPPVVKTRITRPRALVRLFQGLNIGTSAATAGCVHLTEIPVTSVVISDNPATSVSLTDIPVTSIVVSEAVC